MRSHSLAEVETALDDDDDDDGEEQQQRRAFDCVTAPGAGGYGLRENPKKTRRLSSLDDCNSNGHGELLSSYVSEVDHDRHRHRARSGLVMDLELEREQEQEEYIALTPTKPAYGLMPQPRRKRRSMRVPAAVDTEPEDVALSLMMLSRDIIERRRCSRATAEEDNARRERDYRYHQHTDCNDDAKINKRKHDHSLVIDEKRGRYECPGCRRAFQSYQALGGHRASHKRINSNCSIAKPVVDQRPERIVETNISSFNINYTTHMATTAVVALKAKSHKAIKFECPICFRVFGSGQALGGHKRSHSIAGELYERAHADGDEDIDDYDDQPLISNRFLDLNLPAPGVDE